MKGASLLRSGRRGLATNEILGLITRDAFEGGSLGYAHATNTDWPKSACGT